MEVEQDDVPHSSTEACLFSEIYQCTPRSDRTFYIHKGEL